MHVPTDDPNGLTITLIFRRLQDMTKYQNYNDEYIDQLRDTDWNPDWDTKVI